MIKYRLFYSVLALLFCPQGLLASEAEQSGSAISKENTTEYTLPAAMIQDIIKVPKLIR